MSSKSAPEGPAHPARRSRSLAARLTAGYAAAAFALVLVLTLSFYWTLRRNLDDAADLFLADEVHILRTVLRDRPEDRRGLEQEAEWELGARRYAMGYVRVLDDAGRSIVETRGMRDRLPPEVFPEPVE